MIFAQTFLIIGLLSTAETIDPQVVTAGPPIALTGTPRIPIRASDIPLTITTRGYYFLVEDISTAESMAILVDASEVTIDLAGHFLSGNGGFGSYGIVSTQGKNRISVIDGRLSGWTTAISLGGADGPLVGSQCLVDHVIVETPSGYGGGGILVPDSSVIRDSSSLMHGPGIIGMRCGDRCKLENCVVGANATALSVGNDSTITRSMIYSSEAGVSAGDRVHIIDSSINAATEGILGGGNSVIDRSFIYAGLRVYPVADGARIRNSTITGAIGAEFIVGSNCVIEDSVVTGIYRAMVTGTGNRIEGNIFNSVGLDVTGTGNVVVRNFAFGNYSIAPGNIAGPISTSGAMTSPIGNVGE